MKNFVIPTRRLQFLGQVKLGRQLIEIGLPILVGLGLGALTVFTRGVPSKWVGALLLAVMAPVFVLLLGDIKKVILIALVVDIPLEFDVAIQNYGTHQGGPTGYLISLMTIALVIGYALWITDRSKDKVYSFKSMTAPFLVYIFMAVVSIFQSVNVSFSLFSIFLLAQVFLMYFYVINHVKTWADVDLIISIWAACIAFEGIVMILTYLTGIEFSFAGINNYAYYDSSGNPTRVGGTFGSVNDAAIWLSPSLAVMMGAYLAYSELRLPGKQVFLGIFALGGIGLVLTFSRSGWVALALAILMLVSLSIKSGFGRKSLVIVLIFGLIVFGLFAKPMIQRLTGDDEGSAESRRPFEQMARNMIADQPITGVGINNFELRMFDYLPTELWGEFRQYIYVVHDHYLLTWAELGILGLISFVWLLLAAVGQGMRWITNRGIDARSFLFAASLLGALAGYSLHMKSDIFTSRMPVQLLGFMIALITAINNLEKKPMPDDERGELEKERTPMASFGDSS